MSRRRPDDERPKVPAVLTVILGDTFGTETAIIHENEHRPYRKRTVQIRLTEDQRREVSPRYLGRSGGNPRFEEVLEAWLEPASEPIGPVDEGGRT